MAVILSDGRITTLVTAFNASKHSATADLIVDTGAELSVLPYHKLAAGLGRLSAGPIVRMNVGGAWLQTIVVHGATLETDVEPHGGGPQGTAKASKSFPVYLQVTNLFTGFDGLLGMDLLDDFRADAVKDIWGNRAYLAKRA